MDRVRVADAVDELLAPEHYDFVWIDFASMHTAGHQFLDVDAVLLHRGHGPGRPGSASALEDAYVAGDRAIARVLDSCCRRART